MRIKNINQLITNNGTTSDIINVVMTAYDHENDEQIAVVAQQLKGANIYYTCRNIWQHLIDNINYQADSDTGKGEMIRTPARLMHDRTGDCKSYSLFTATVLRFLNIKHVFRFASYNNKAEATHVYVIAYDENNNEICIDAVAAVQINADFDEEKQYSFKCDMANGRTKISYLAGLENSNSIGAMTDNYVYSVWTNNRREQDITPGHNYLYSEYDLQKELISIANSSNIASRYNDLAITAALLWAYDFVNGDTPEFLKCTAIMAMMLKEGLFTSKEINPQARDAWFAMLIDEMERRFSNPINGINASNANMSFFNKIKTEVAENNIVVQWDDDFSNIGAIGGFTPMSDAIKKAGIYFIYMFIPDSELKQYPSSVERKRKTQIIFFNLLHKAHLFANSTTVRNLIRSGIIARTGLEPEAYLKKFKSENPRIGVEPITLATVSTIIAVVMGLIELIKAIFPKSDAARYAPSSGVADLQNEVYGYKPKTTQGGSTTKSSLMQSSSLWLGLGLVASFFLIKKKS